MLCDAPSWEEGAASFCGNRGAVARLASPPKTTLLDSPSLHIIKEIISYTHNPQRGNSSGISALILRSGCCRGFCTDRSNCPYPPFGTYVGPESVVAVQCDSARHNGECNTSQPMSLSMRFCDLNCLVAHANRAAGTSEGHRSVDGEAQLTRKLTHASERGGRLAATTRETTECNDDLNFNCNINNNSGASNSRLNSNKVVSKK